MHCVELESLLHRDMQLGHGELNLLTHSEHRACTEMAAASHATSLVTTNECHKYTTSVDSQMHCVELESLLHHDMQLGHSGLKLLTAHP